MFSSKKTKIAAAVVLLTLVLVPAPLLPPLGLTGKVQSTFHVNWKAAFLVTTLALHVVLYGSLGVVSAFAAGPARNRRHRIKQLIILPVVVIGLATLVRSLKLGHVPVLANAVLPLSACALGTIIGLLLRQSGWRVALASMVVVLLSLLWAYWPGVSSELSRASESRLRKLVAAASTFPSGEDRYGAIIRTAFEQTPSASTKSTAIKENSAAILALGIALGHERLARYAGLDPRSELVRTATSLRPGTTLRGREDWVRHYCLSAALVVVEDPFISDAGGLIKEELDALTQGSGFSFGDLAADRAGARFAEVATKSEPSAKAMQARLRDGFAMDDFFPPITDLPENLTMEQFRSEYGGVGSTRYRQTAREIEARLNRCAAISSSQGTKAP